MGGNNNFNNKLEKKIQKINNIQERIRKIINKKNLFKNKYRDEKQSKNHLSRKLTRANELKDEYKSNWDEDKQKIPPLKENIRSKYSKILDLNENIRGLNIDLGVLKQTVIPNLNLDIDGLYNIVLSNDLSNNIQLLEQSLDSKHQVEKYLLDNYPITSSSLITEKINYREIEHEKLKKINKLLDIIFYIFFFTFLIIIIVGGNFIFKERFLIYLIIILFTFLYPFIFKFMKSVYNNIFVKNYGPKGAFIDILPSYDAYNI